MRARIDYTKKKVGKLIGIRVIGKTECENKLLIWEMRCDCGEIVTRTASQIRSNSLMTCMDCKVDGCLKNPRQSKFFKGQLRQYNKKEV